MATTSSNPPTAGEAPDGVLVVVPARDEATRVDGALHAIARAAHRVDVRVVVVVVDNASTDRTAAVAGHVLRRRGLRGEVVSSDAASIGTARHAGVLAARRRGLLDDRRSWRLLSTDADTLVPASWMEDHLAHATDGAVAVAGSVRLIADADATDVEAAWWEEYGATLEPSGAHPHVHAANLSIDLATYERVGGFPDCVRAEDIALWTRLRAEGLVPVADHRLRVDTSARRDARCPGGFGLVLQERYRS